VPGLSLFPKELQTHDTVFGVIIHGVTEIAVFTIVTRHDTHPSFNAGQSHLQGKFQAGFGALLFPVMKFGANPKLGGGNFSFVVRIGKKRIHPPGSALCLRIDTLFTPVQELFLLCRLRLFFNLLLRSFSRWLIRQGHDWRHK
jgi:hypothetical protein